MLKRHQVLLTDWQTDHLKTIAKRNDLSFSEMIRVVLCEGLLHTALTLHPECRDKTIKDKLERIAREGHDLETTPVKKQQLISELYFETRKLTECINEKLAKETKPREKKA